MATIEHTGLLKYVDGNNNINVLYPEIGKKITLADYLALPEEEQKTGAYWIEDANEPLGDGSRFLKTTDVVDSFDSSDSTLPLSANKGRELKESLNTINKPIVGNMFIDKSGNVCVLTFTGYSAQLSDVIPGDCRPKNTVRCMVRYSDGNGFYPALISIEPNGTMSGTFIKNNNPTDFLDTGVLYGQAVWCM